MAPSLQPPRWQCRRLLTTRAQATTYHVIVGRRGEWRWLKQLWWHHLPAQMGCRLMVPPSLPWPHHRSSSFCSRCYARMVGRTRTVGRSVGWMDGKAGSSDTAAARRQLLCTSVYIQYKQCRRPRPLGLGPESNSLDQASRRFCAPKMWFSILAFLLPAASYLSQGRCTRVS